MFLCGVANLALVGYILARYRRRWAHVCFSSTVLFLALWNFTCFVLASTDNEATIDIAGKVSFVIGLGIVVSYLILTWIFPEETGRLPKTYVWISVLLVAFCLAGLTAFTPLIQAGVQVTPDARHPIYGELFPLYDAFILFVFAWSNYNLIRSRAAVPRGRPRMQVTYMMGGFVIAFSLRCLVPGRWLQSP